MRKVFLGQRGHKKKYAYLHGDGKITLETVVDVEPVLERNKRMQNLEKGTNKQWFGLYGIPDIFVSKWLHEDGVNILRLPKDELKRYLLRKVGRNPDYMYLRMHGGRY